MSSARAICLGAPNNLRSYTNLFVNHLVVNPWYAADDLVYVHTYMYMYENAYIHMSRELFFTVLQARERRCWLEPLLPKQRYHFCPSLALTLSRYMQVSVPLCVCVCVYVSLLQ